MWFWYDWDMSYRIHAIYTSPEAAIRRQSTEGYGKIAFVEYGEIRDLSGAIDAYEKAERKKA